MADIRLVWDAAQAICDWQIVPGDLATGDDLRTAVLVSLFTDRAAPAEAVPPGGDRRGFWADAYEAPIGSQLWRLERATKTAATLRAAEDYAREALAWLVEDGVAAAVGVTAAWIGRNALGLRIVLSRPAGGATVFDFAWESN